MACWSRSTKQPGSVVITYKKVAAKEPMKDPFIARALEEVDQRPHPRDCVPFGRQSAADAEAELDDAGPCEEHDGGSG